MAAARILIVEDERLVAEDIKLTLLGFGYQIAGITTTGEEAIRLARDATPDLILMDIHLAGTINGIAAAEEIQKFSAVPVVYLTAFADENITAQAKITQPYGYIIKPYDERELRTVIEFSLFKSQLDQKLKESEEKYRALAENTADVLFALDVNGIVTYISPHVNKYGYLVEDLVLGGFCDFVYPQDRKIVRENFLKVLSCERQESTVFRVVDKWGYIHWVEERSTVRMDVYGRPIGIYGTLRDITDRRRAEESFVLANKKLNLLNNITRHDILNTITGLLGLIDMSLASKEMAERDELLQEIKNSVEIIQHQISFTREYQEVGVNAPIWQEAEAILQRVIPDCSRPGIAIVSQVKGIGIFADPLLEKVFYNLIDNALRYGGETLTTVTFFEQVSDEGLILVCEDNGAGIPPEEKKKVFERGIGKNTGMGLFLTREILLITGITIRETGILGKGARFEILIPNGAWRLTKTNV
ncbi:multi-sensor signal transduction histidine kinase [Methanoregula boonei 6A8]|jgi:PAS domain S-box-containing protein|uniref:histidine kinase n=1 Tax=Methanoregula boonei (strain DSM 21154 / JCM 14090 / 6A8) TaxID=456442 RepID=A7I7P9_METB6|nr:response regulator [Methanoregula boonei]ABS55760.1 multi-sensor signal transduction histidine kinase [Methanoregula boonei 6A8]